MLAVAITLLSLSTLQSINTGSDLTSTTLHSLQNSIYSWFLIGYRSNVQSPSSSRLPQPVVPSPRSAPPASARALVELRSEGVGVVRAVPIAVPRGAVGRHLVLAHVVGSDTQGTRLPAITRHHIPVDLRPSTTCDLASTEMKRHSQRSRTDRSSPCSWRPHPRSSCRQGPPLRGSQCPRPHHRLRRCCRLVATAHRRCMTWCRLGPLTKPIFSYGQELPFNSVCWLCLTVN